MSRDSYKSWFLALFGAAAIVGLSACGAATNSLHTKSQGQNSQASSLSASQREALSLQVPVSVGPSVEQQLALALAGDPSKSGLELASASTQSLSPSSFEVEVGDCASNQYSSNDSTAKLAVLINDQHCLAKLISVTLDGQVYLPEGHGSKPFANWLKGDIASFIGANASDVVKVMVIRQLSSPIQKTDSVKYAYTKTSAKVSTAEQTAMLFGVQAPNFTIEKGDITMNGIITEGSSAGAGTFSFQLTCTTGSMTASTTPGLNCFCPDSVEGGTLLNGDSGVDVCSSNKFSYKLISDLNGDGTLTMPQAQDAFAEGGDNVINPKTDILEGDRGFKTISLTGPVSVTSNPRMLLVLQAKSPEPEFSKNPQYSSFQYFPIIVIPLKTNK